MNKLSINNFAVINNKLYKLVLEGNGIKDLSPSTQDRVKKIAQDLFQDLNQEVYKNPSFRLYLSEEDSHVEVYQGTSRVENPFLQDQANKVRELYQTLRTQDVVHHAPNFQAKKSSPIVIKVEHVAKKALEEPILPPSEHFYNDPSEVDITKSISGSSLKDYTLKHDSQMSVHEKVGSFLRNSFPFSEVESVREESSSSVSSLTESEEISGSEKS